MSIKKNLHAKVHSFLPPLFALTIFIIIWESMVLLFSIPEYIIPAPHMIFIEFIENWSSVSKNFIITFIESFGGFLIGNILGFLVSILFVHSKTASKIGYPYAVILKSIPIITIAPLLIIWFGNGITGKVVMSALICFFPAIVNGTKGLQSIDQEALDLFKSLFASKWQIFIKLRLPSSVPYLFSALKISSTLSVVGAIVAEFTGATSGLGFLITMASYRYNTSLIFVGIIGCGFAGLLLFSTVAIFEKIFSNRFQNKNEINDII